MPAARVSVQTQTVSSFLVNSSSTTRRYLPSMPAWWTPTPRRSICLSLGPTPSRQSSLSTASLSGPLTPGGSRSRPLSISAVLQHSSRLKQNTSAGVVRAAGSALAISTSCSPRNSSLTQRNVSGTLRSLLSTSSSLRPWLRSSHLRNSAELPTVAERRRSLTEGGSNARA